MRKISEQIAYTLLTVIHSGEWKGVKDGGFYIYSTKFCILFCSFKRAALIIFYLIYEIKKMNEMYNIPNNMGLHIVNNYAFKKQNKNVLWN